MSSRARPFVVRRIVLAGAFATALSACGFQLRGAGPTDLKSLLVSSDVPSQVALEVRRQLSGTGTKVAASPREAEALLRILGERTDKTIQSLTGAGRVFDYRLSLKVRYQVTDAAGNALVEPAEIEQWRIISYSETAPLAKEAEEQLLFAEMRDEAARGILRRIAVVRGNVPAR